MERRIDELGRVVIPRHVRRTLGFESKTPMHFEIVGDGVLLTKACPTCCVCNSDKDLAPIKDKYICSSCKVDILK